MFVMATDQEYGTVLRRKINAEIIGVGPIEAAIGTTLALQKRIDIGRRPSAVVSLGSAGSASYEIGSVWQISRVC
jgi:adenosylhomocysteine nucleosidase